MSKQSTDEANVSIKREFSCASCLYSRAQLSFESTDPDLMCAKSGEKTTQTCEDFTYEPGTDEHETVE